MVFNMARFVFIRGIFGKRSNKPQLTFDWLMIEASVTPLRTMVPQHSHEAVCCFTEIRFFFGNRSFA
jgi:hypothetical protein